MTDMRGAMRRDVAPAADESGGIAGDSELVTLAQELVALKETIAADAEELKNKRARYDELRNTLIPEMMHALGLVGPDGKGGFTLATGEKLFIRNDLHAGYTKENEQRVFDWLRRRGNEALIKETVHAGTLKALVKEIMEKGESVPEEIVKVYTFQSINVRR